MISYPNYTIGVNLFRDLRPSNPAVIGTFSGKYVDLLDPQPEDILIEDIAHQLSNHCRFGGTSRQFYSVAEHSVTVSELSTDDPFGGLMHDASEAYLCDIPTPLKNLLPNYLEIEGRFMRTIADKFGFKYPLTDSVLKADEIALQIEFEKYVLGDDVSGLIPLERKSRFLDKFHELK